MGDYRYDRPIAIAPGVYWVGFHDERADLHCNPYLVVDGDEAVLIDGGSRPDFAVVMTKILQTGVAPQRIKALVYHHSDPDLCGSMANFVDMVNNPDLMIVTEQSSYAFLTYYLSREQHRLLTPLDTIGYRLPVGERTLCFYHTPYSHTAGSFVTHDPVTGVLFSSDLFGSFSRQWELYLELSEDCPRCRDYTQCVNHRPYCPLPDILAFHRKIMPSGKALRLAMETIGCLAVRIIAP
ncbi:MAG: MBL fold metallo-hydrolase, partial [Syntrophales bacterium]|nr:MBL fold metallo-hydrolase [Syntrophales bacterium]